MIWSVIHDFMHGYGYQSSDDLVIFASEVKYYLGKDLFIEAPSENNVAVDSEKVQVLFNEIKTKRILKINNIRTKNIAEFEKIRIPLIKQPFPKLPW